MQSKSPALETVPGDWANNGVQMQLTYMSAPTGYTAPSAQPFVEYPKYVHFDDKRPSVIVQNAEEEAALRAGEAIPAPAPVISSEPAPVPVLVGQNDGEAMLRKIAAEKGIRIDGRWKLPKIRKAVEAATNA